MIVIKSMQGLNLKIFKSTHDLILALVEVLNLILFSLSDSLFEFVEVAIDCFEIWIELVYKPLFVISDSHAYSPFDFFSHFLKKILELRTLRLVDE